MTVEPAAAAMPTLDDIRRAAEVVSQVTRVTPMLTSTTLSEMTGAKVLLKAENLQRTGAFKVRGAANKLSTLTAEERRRGVVAASAGNHAQGVALAARSIGIPCTIVMPRDASIPKVEATRNYGAKVVLEGTTVDEALAHARKLSEQKNMVFVHPFDDPAVIAGQGTLGLEILEQAPDAEVVVVAIGGGGLISGVATAITALNPKVRVVGVQAAAAPAMANSIREGHIVTAPVQPTLADGIAVGRPGELTFQIIRDKVSGVVTVDNEAISHAQVLLLERGKLLVEGAGAASVAALLQGLVQCRGQKVVALLSGGNVDISLLAHVLDHGMARLGRFNRFRIAMPDRPGELARVSTVMASQRGNVQELSHTRRSPRLPMGYAEVEMLVETRDVEHAESIAHSLESAGYRREHDLCSPGEYVFIG